MLSNLATKNLDTELFIYAEENGFVYTRYADDIYLSTVYLLKKKSISIIHKEVIKIIQNNYFVENHDKF